MEKSGLVRTTFLKNPVRNAYGPSLPVSVWFLRQSLRAGLLSVVIGATSHIEYGDTACPVLGMSSCPKTQAEESDANPRSLEGYRRSC